MFAKERHSVAIRIRMNGENAQTYQEDLKSFNTFMTASAIFQEIGFQAAFAAATMGAAAYFTTTARMAQAGAWLANLGKGTRAIQFVAKVGGMSAGVEGAAAMTGILSRASAGVTILMLRRLTGDLGTKRAMNFDSFGTAIFLAVAFAWVGSPGSPAKTINPLKRLLEHLPGVLSAQGGVQGIGLLKQGLTTWMQQPDSKAIMEIIRKNRIEFNRQIDAFAEKQARDLMDWAITAEDEIAKKVSREAQKIDYNAKLPFIARHTDISNNTRRLKQLSITIAQYETKFQFWIGVADCLRGLEESVNEAKCFIN